MADITMCKNIACSLHESCYRYLADPNPLIQAYFVDDGFVNGCKFYMPMVLNKEEVWFPTDGDINQPPKEINIENDKLSEIDIQN